MQSSGRELDALKGQTEEHRRKVNGHGGHREQQLGVGLVPLGHGLLAPTDKVPRPRAHFWV